MHTIKLVDGMMCVMDADGYVLNLGRGGCREAKQ